ncbi:hypothetical protein QT974_17260 [Microcoleus sp. herbarium12]
MKQLLTVKTVGSCFILDGWVVRNRVFAIDFVTVRRFGEKPGFFDLWVSGEKPGFCDRTSLQPADSGKNPVSKDCARVSSGVSL